MTSILKGRISLNVVTNAALFFCPPSLRFRFELLLFLEGSTLPDFNANIHEADIGTKAVAIKTKLSFSIHRNTAIVILKKCSYTYLEVFKL